MTGSLVGDEDCESSDRTSDPTSDRTSDRTSWSSTLDVELQRDLMVMRLFDGAPVTINRFLVEKLLGVGASAAVYATRDPLLDRRVAIKVLAQPRDGRLAEATARVIREARALAQLSHPSIVSIYEVGQWNGRPFIAMELIEGVTLARWLAAAPRTVTEICETFLQAGRGLAAAHARGRVHRDFKPANVLVADDGRVVVSDFGLALRIWPIAGLSGERTADRTTDLPARGARLGRAGWLVRWKSRRMGSALVAHDRGVRRPQQRHLGGALRRRGPLAGQR
jgi:serine/threonine protein kinase